MVAAFDSRTVNFALNARILDSKRIISVYADAQVVTESRIIEKLL
jgi:hypothetical protein